MTQQAKKRNQTLWRDLILLVMWMAFIWLHSLVKGNNSLQESNFFVNLLSPHLSLIGIDDSHTQSFIVRKTAHYLEYLVLGILACRATRPHRGLSIAALIVIVAATPIIDESIQLLTPGREGRIFDVLLDMSGALTGVIIFAIVHACVVAYRKRHPKAPPRTPKHFAQK
ncbi:MAG: VanZ family protein [Atopobiaceae bacterium]|nr:VanZ family protein [Atopobiaceae bacterium]